MSEPPRPLAQAALGADVWFDFAVAYQLYSPAYHAALANGCIYVCLTGMDVDMLVRTVGRVAYAPMEEMARVLYRMSQAAETIRVTSPAGTDLRMTVDKRGDPFWETEKHGGYAQMLGGQSGPMAHRESFEGVLVYDGAIWPPAEIGIVRTPVRLTIERGYATRIEGGAEAVVYDRWLRSFESSRRDAHGPRLLRVQPGSPAAHRANPRGRADLRLHAVRDRGNGTRLADPQRRRRAEPVGVVRPASRSRSRVGTCMPTSPISAGRWGSPGIEMTERPAAFRARPAPPQSGEPADPLVISESEALTLLAHLVTSAELCMTEPYDYGIFRLIDAASRLAEGDAAAIERREPAPSWRRSSVRST